MIEGRSSNTTDLVARAEGTPTPPNVTLTADSVTTVDPADSKFRITYKYDSVRIKAADVFTSFLDALAVSAEHDLAEVWCFRERGQRVGPVYDQRTRNL